ncbi:MAG TPA: hypothetical protein VIL43_01560 [Burkholderiales bacterium]
MKLRSLLFLTAAVAASVHAHESTIRAPTTPGISPAFDIVESRVRVEGGEVVFTQRVAGTAGAEHPAARGRLGGALVYSYVWPTSLDSSAVGFDERQGILALAATIHPDFDDTPLYDEDGDGDKKNDGTRWHSHWVVLVKDERCGPGGMKVRDIPKGAKPKLPATWPGLPILIDSPGYTPVFEGPTVQVRLPLRDIGAPSDFRFDGVTSSLQVNASVHDPLLCINRVFDVASGDLSLPGSVSH